MTQIFLKEIAPKEIYHILIAKGTGIIVLSSLVEKWFLLPIDNFCSPGFLTGTINRSLVPGKIIRSKNRFLVTVGVTNRK